MTSPTGTGAEREAPFGVVVNPRSARGRGLKVARRVLAALDAAGVPVVRISGRGAAECQERVAAVCEQGVRGLILVGGDGLIGLVLQVEAARSVPIGIVPAGSGNDFARQFDLSRLPARAVKRVLAAEAAPQRVDLGVATLPDGREHWFGCALNVGFDAAVNRRANAIPLPIGPLSYHVGLLIELAVLRMRRFNVQMDAGGSGTSAEHTFDGLLTTVMNTRCIGGGIPLAPRASAHDGKLDLVEVSRGSKLRILSVLGVLARGKHEPLPEVTITHVDRVRIDAGDEVAYSDGEPVGTGPFEVRIEPAALTLLA